MRSIVFALAAVAAGTALHAGPSHAQQYAYCLISDLGPGDCRYASYAQCQATASGTGYFCQPNYALAPSDAVQGSGPRARRAGRVSGYGPQY